MLGDIRNHLNLVIHSLKKLRWSKVRIHTRVAGTTFVYQNSSEFECHLISLCTVPGEITQALNTVLPGKPIEDRHVIQA